MSIFIDSTIFSRLFSDEPVVKESQSILDIVEEIVNKWLKPGILSKSIFLPYVHQVTSILKLMISCVRSNVIK